MKNNMLNISPETRILLNELKMMIEDYVYPICIPDRCKYCRCFISEPQSLSQVYQFKQGFCSKWCNEQMNPPAVKHTCKECGVVVESYKHKGRNTPHRYPTYCTEHRRKYNRKKGYCTLCKNEMQPRLNNDGSSKGSFNKYCPDCRKSGKHLTKNKK